MHEAMVKVQIPLPKRTKLGPKTVDYVYLSPTKNSVAYRFLVYKSCVEDISDNTIIEPAEAEFFENIFPYKDKEKQILNPRKRVIDNQLSQDKKNNNSEVLQENIEPRRSKRAKVTKDFGTDYMTYVVNEEPQTYKATMESSEAPYWKEAIQSEIDSIIDVKTAFLNGELDEEIYMQQPEGFVVKCQEHKICKLVKSLYDLKQAPKQWHEKFDNTLLSKAFHINECDKCVYVKQYKNAFVIICLYVDDMLIMGTNMDVINQTKKMLHSSFDVKDMGEADVILGIRIQNNSNGYILTQSHYIENTLKKFGHYDDRPVVTPFDPKVQLKKNKGQSVSQLHYTQVLGSLMYIMNCTRPDLAYSVSRLRRYSHNPVLEGYCDANWISIYNEGKSTSGYVFTLGGVVVSWKLSKQTVNTSSTMEAEFVALDKAAKEAEWLRSFLEEMGRYREVGVGRYREVGVAGIRRLEWLIKGKGRLE
ncbi:retrotransposon protein, putative, ty1-copia subclass [Tanacetum coccineum]|uniref:Retrotransposon protein, putative, ty1-copia subclass n=1 Tax=Tanacetum coccineum TaxID=301880 RepID=A0ABQ5HZ75_9ASTR